ncbi:hypothetical protein C1I95_07725 [Micromonospora craterilacus]|uniref:Uncharacterized protein n=1 Tax=Micromonospora craterilacus TaxID=1655439 RepID=A0A2W2G312_9ACTN|nr:hypothetical protein C1I95_07725 [Micromonospora craterilacus]
MVALNAQTGRRERRLVTRSRSGPFILPWRAPHDRHPAPATPTVPVPTTRPTLAARKLPVVPPAAGTAPGHGDTGAG